MWPSDLSCSPYSFVVKETLSALFYLLTNSDQLLYGSWPPSPNAVEILALAGVSPRLGHLTHPGPPAVQASPPSSEGVGGPFEMSARVSLQAGLVRSNNVSSMVDYVGVKE